MSQNTKTDLIRLSSCNSILQIDVFLQGREIAESARQDVDPESDLEIGSLIKEYKENPNEGEVRMDIGHKTREKWIPVERKQGKILDSNVKTGK